MFEYIKRVSIAIKFIAGKIQSNKSLKDILEIESLEFLKLAQDFRSEDYELETLKKLQQKVLYIIDVVDFARIHNLISVMNAKVFIDSLTNFLKYNNHLIDQIYSLDEVLLNLKKDEDLISRKIAKETLQNKYSYEDLVKETLPKMTPFIPAQPLEKKILEEVQISETPVVKTQQQTQTRAQIDAGIKAEMESRRNRILETLSLGGGSIKDVTGKLPDMSEKTVQRDLIELMRDKKIVMMGKKRWAKYYIK